MPKRNQCQNSAKKVSSKRGRSASGAGAVNNPPPNADTNPPEITGQASSSPGESGVVELGLSQDNNAVGTHMATHESQGDVPHVGGAFLFLDSRVLSQWVQNRVVLLLAWGINF